MLQSHLLLPFFAIAFVGCDSIASSNAQPQPAIASEQTAGNRSELSRTIDAGIIIASRSNYLCQSFEYFGLDCEIDVVGISTSCECATASIVSYARSHTKQSRALLIEFNPDRPSEVLQEPSKLAIVVKLETATGENHEVVVKMHHTHLPGIDE